MTMPGPLPQSPVALRIYTCKKCVELYMVWENDPDIHLLKKSMRCPNSEVCGGRIKVYATTNMRAKRSQKISALQLYQASLGAGLPMEKRCSPKEMRKLLLGAQVTGIDLTESADPQRSLIKSLTLDGGMTVHFSASTKGATIFKVTGVR